VADPRAAAEPVLSDLERELLWQLRVQGCTTAVTQFRFDPRRRWRLDLAWPDLWLGVEVDGGTWTGGRHVRPAGFAGDCDKHNAATLAGWSVLRFTTDHVRDGSAAQLILAELHKRESD
jgi:very-short-patch-repair endonuclease